MELSQLQSNYRNLEKQRDAYKDELDTLKHLQESEQDRFSALQTQNNELNDDVTMLKNLVYRLNVELDRYQQRLQKQTGKNELPPLKVTTPSIQEKEAAMLWKNINKTALKPLLDAYEETLKEKDDLIYNYEQSLNKAVSNCKQLAAENEELHESAAENRKQVSA